jgi:hypothetical protein
MKHYNLKQLNSLIDKYINEYQGELITLEEGVLGYGTIVLCNGVNAKTFVINEHYISPWCSDHVVRAYKKMPKKIEKMIESLETVNQ